MFKSITIFIVMIVSIGCDSIVSPDSVDTVIENGNLSIDSLYHISVNFTNNDSCGVGARAYDKNSFYIGPISSERDWHGEFYGPFFILSHNHKGEIVNDTIWTIPFISEEYLVNFISRDVVKSDRQ